MAQIDGDKPIQVYLHGGDHKDGDSKGSVLANIEQIARIIAAIALPVVIAVVGSCYTRQQHDADALRTAAEHTEELHRDYVKIAVGILQEPKSQDDGDLRNWAIDTLNHYAEVHLQKKAVTQLQSGESILPASINLNAASAQRPPSTSNGARVYILMTDQNQEQRAAAVNRILSANGYSVYSPTLDIENQQHSELRFFQPDDAAEAAQIASALKQQGIVVAPRQMSSALPKGFRARHFEVALGKAD